MVRESRGTGRIFRHTGATSKLRAQTTNFDDTRQAFFAERSCCNVACFACTNETIGIDLAAPSPAIFTVAVESTFTRRPIATASRIECCGSAANTPNARQTKFA